ncbi:GGDEF domain-containing protein [Pseudomonadota bacterium]
MGTQMHSTVLKQDNILVFQQNHSTADGSTKGPDPRLLELGSLLHTTLEIDELISLFSSHISPITGHDGITYTHADHGIEIQLGKHARHNCNYQLTSNGEALGEITFFRRKALSEEELATLENLLCALIYPLHNALLYHRAIQSALVDPLTGVKNRSSMDATIQREVDLAQRHGTPLSVLLLDIDHFKSINDRFGHACGDYVIQAVAQCISETVRGSDMVFRFGGEEFLVLLSCTDCKGTCLLAERIRQNIENLAFSRESELLVTASLGISCLQMEDKPEDLFKRADKALYQAKKYGRNQVITG